MITCFGLLCPGPEDMEKHRDGATSPPHFQFVEDGEEEEEDLEEDEKVKIIITLISSIKILDHGSNYHTFIYQKQRLLN